MSFSSVDASSLQSPIGLVAGNGKFPLQFAENAREQGLEVVAIAHSGETDPKLEELVSSILWIKLGQFGKLIKRLKQSSVKQVAFAGGISRLEMFSGTVMPDLRGLSLLARVRSTKDDVILRAIATEIEEEGIEVISATTLLKDCIPEKGCLTKRGLSESERTDAEIGWEASKIIGAADIGQSVSVSERMIVAVEAIEGTDRLIRRTADLINKKPFVVVKTSKPQQDLRLDLPTIGIGTIDSMKEAGASALVIESGKTLILEPQVVISQANLAGIVIEAF